MLKILMINNLFNISEKSRLIRFNYLIFYWLNKALGKYTVNPSFRNGLGCLN